MNTLEAGDSLMIDATSAAALINDAILGSRLRRRRIRVVLR